MRLNSFMVVLSKRRRSHQTSVKMCSITCPMLTLTKCRTNSYLIKKLIKPNHLKNLSCFHRSRSARALRCHTARTAFQHPWLMPKMAATRSTRPMSAHAVRRMAASWLRSTRPRVDHIWPWHLCQARARRTSSQVKAKSNFGPCRPGRWFTFGMENYS